MCLDPEPYHPSTISDFRSDPPHYLILSNGILHHPRPTPPNKLAYPHVPHFHKAPPSISYHLQLPTIASFTDTSERVPQFNFTTVDPIPHNIRTTHYIVFGRSSYPTLSQPHPILALSGTVFSRIPITTPKHLPTAIYRLPA